MQTPTTETTSLLHTCRNCENTFNGSYCNQCGQESADPDHTLRGILARLLGEFFHDVKMFLFTSLELLLRPGKTISGYLSGKHKTYYNAFNYFLVAGSLATVLTLWRSQVHPETIQETVKMYEQTYQQMGVTYNKSTLEFLAKYVLWIQENYNVILLLTLPFLALATWLIFRKRGYNYGEHLLINCYTYGLFTVLSLPALPFMDTTRPDSPALFITFPLVLLYYAWTFRDFFRISWGKAIFRSVLSQALYFVVFMVFVAIATLLAILCIILYFSVRKALG
ncbi:MAG: DUF3667 domain-containing protein [Bacteroidetes bacterium]|nr:MAG: DUF3667 domain-containing protein [Bacteroidota bacterium]